MGESNEEVKQDYIVEIEQVVTHRYLITDVNSPEEAQEVAEDWLADDEDGEIIGSEVLNCDAYPIDSKEETS